MSFKRQTIFYCDHEHCGMSDTFDGWSLGDAQANAVKAGWEFVTPGKAYCSDHAQPVAKAVELVEDLL